MPPFPDAAAVAAVRASIQKQTGLFIDGDYVAAQSAETIDVENPATGEKIGEVARGAAGDVDLAVSAARRAFEQGPWPSMPASERARILYRFADLVEAAGDELAILETLDNGMPYAFSRHAAVSMAVESLRYYAGWPTKLGGETLPVSAPGEWLGYTLRQPVGVVAAIAAWNFPLAMACGKIAPALAAGCTVILKPAEQAPLTALRLGRIAAEAGVPEGVLNIVSGYGKEAGQALVDHPGVDKISFTGSTTTGKAILAASARDLKRVTLELGGKSPTVIFADADIPAAIEGAAMGVFFNSGQICVARSRLFVHEKVYDAVVEGMAGFARHLKVGDPFAPETVLGPLVSEAQFDRVRRYIGIGAEEGGQIIAGGERVGTEGYFVQPTLIANTRPDATVLREEIFGPVVVAVPFADDDIDMIAARANDTPYGLAASVWTRDLSTAHRMATRIKAGTVEINGAPPMQFSLPFGGLKQSGIGRENGRAGIEAFTETKSITVRL